MVWLFFRLTSTNRLFIRCLIEVSLQVTDQNIFDIFVKCVSLNRFSIITSVLKKKVQYEQHFTISIAVVFSCTATATKIQLDITCAYLTLILNYCERFREIFSSFRETYYILPNKMYPPITRI